MGQYLQLQNACDAWKLCKALKGPRVTDFTQIQAVTIGITAAVSAAVPQLAKLLGVTEYGYYKEERE